MNVLRKMRVRIGPSSVVTRGWKLYMTVVYLQYKYNCTLYMVGTSSLVNSGWKLYMAVVYLQNKYNCTVHMIGTSSLVTSVRFMINVYLFHFLCFKFGKTRGSDLLTVKY